jgi:hypothetical protein
MAAAAGKLSFMETILQKVCFIVACLALADGMSGVSVLLV